MGPSSCPSAKSAGLDMYQPPPLENDLLKSININLVCLLPPLGSKLPKVL